MLLAEIVEYKRQFSVRALTLLVTERSQPMNAYSLRTRLDTARQVAGIPKTELQFRDLRPKAATEVDERAGVRQAQALLEHTTEGMKSHYIRHKSGKLVKPTKTFAEVFAEQRLRSGYFERYAKTAEGLDI